MTGPQGAEDLFTGRDPGLFPFTNGLGHRKILKHFRENLMEQFSLLL